MLGLKLNHVSKRGYRETWRYTISTELHDKTPGLLFEAFNNDVCSKELRHHFDTRSHANICGISTAIVKDPICFTAIWSYNHEGNRATVANISKSVVRTVSADGLPPLDAWISTNKLWTTSMIHTHSHALRIRLLKLTDKEDCPRARIIHWLDFLKSHTNNPNGWPVSVRCQMFSVSLWY